MNDKYKQKVDKDIRLLRQRVNSVRTRKQRDEILAEAIEMSGEWFKKGIEKYPTMLNEGYMVEDVEGEASASISIIKETISELENMKFTENLGRRLSEEEVAEMEAEKNKDEEESTDSFPSSASDLGEIIKLFGIALKSQNATMTVLTRAETNAQKFGISQNLIDNTVSSMKKTNRLLGEMRETLKKFKEEA